MGTIDGVAEAAAAAVTAAEAAAVTAAEAEAAAVVAAAVTAAEATAVTAAAAVVAVIGSSIASGNQKEAAAAAAKVPVTLTTTATSDGAFSLTFSNIAHAGRLEVTAYQSDNPSCSDKKTFKTIRDSAPASVITLSDIIGSSLNLQLILPGNFQPQTANSSVFFSDVCNFAGAQSDGHVSGTFKILSSSDMFASDAFILNGQHNVFVDCSDQCLNIAQQSNQFLFQICSFTSDPVIKYSDGNPAHLVSDHHVTIGSIAAQISDIVTFSLIQIPNFDGPLILPPDPGTFEMLLKAMFILIFFVTFGMIFFPG